LGNAATHRTYIWLDLTVSKEAAGRRGLYGIAIDHNNLRALTRGTRGLRGLRGLRPLCAGFRRRSRMTIPSGGPLLMIYWLSECGTFDVCAHKQWCKFLRRRVSAGSWFRPRSLSVSNVEVGIDPARTQMTTTATVCTVCPCRVVLYMMAYSGIVCW